ncbi:MAG: phosphate acyltransferase PlsX [Firmicutes bacterium]|nr:phosphate acyltransferase PlsX [Bacillota bacterium]
MWIAIDAMGGDGAPAETVKGAVRAVRELGIGVILAGDPQAVGAHIQGADARLPGLEIAPATEVIGPDDIPTAAVRRKKDSSMVVGIRMVKEGQAAGFLSAGNTGAFMTAALLILGRIPGVERPALAPVVPSLSSRGTLFLDVGANATARPSHLLHYAIMGSAYARSVLGIEAPRVGLLNVGTEEGKGNEVVQQAYHLIQRAVEGFSGNVEGRDIFNGETDVVVCDGFIGNIVLKSIEGFAHLLGTSIRNELNRGVWPRLGGLLCAPGLRRVRLRMDYAHYGGAPFLGVQGVCVKCHGSSNAEAIRNGLRLARDFAREGVIDNIRDQIERWRELGVHQEA